MEVLSDKQLMDRQLQVSSVTVATTFRVLAFLSEPASRVGFQLAAQLAAENNTLRIELQRLREEVSAGQRRDDVSVRAQQRSYEEVLSVKNEALEVSPGLLPELPPAS